MSDGYSEHGNTTMKVNASSTGPITQVSWFDVNNLFMFMVRRLMLSTVFLVSLVN